MNNLFFCKNKLENFLDKIELNLSNKTVLTEAASGPYAVTAILAAMAGAKVYAFSKDTKYGTIKEVFLENIELTEKYKLNNIHLIDQLTPEILSEVDIITNSGHLRPLDEEKLKYTKKGVVIPLMYESWELREEDIDMKFCQQRKVSIAGTNERHPNIDVFNYTGDMAIKLIFDSGKCLYNNSFVLISNNDFGPFIAKAVSKLCSKLGVIDLEKNKKNYNLSGNCKWISNFPEIKSTREFKDAEAIILTACPFVDTWIDTKGIISTESIMRAFSNPDVLRFTGHVNTEALDADSISYYPQSVPRGHMGILLSDIGYDSVIRLQAGGLKVAEEMLNNKWDSKYIQPIIQY
jgi:hypothetical protein